MTDYAITTSGPTVRRLAGFEIRTSPELLVVAAATYFTILCNFRFWSLLLEGEAGGGAAAISLFLSTFFLLTGVHVVLLAPFSSRRVIKPFLLLLFGANAFTLYFMDQFGVYVDTSMIRNVFQTDAAETAELLSWQMVPYVFVYALVPAFFVLRTRLSGVGLATAAKRKALLLALGVAAVSLAGVVSFKDYSSFFRNHKPARYLVTPANYMVSVARVGFSSGRELRKERVAVGRDARLGAAWAESNRPVLFVLVVGETARASSFSLNGYSRDTNPRLGSVPGLVNFGDVSACGTSTADSLPCMFSSFARSDPDHKRAREYESLLDVVRRSGLDVTWLDNNSGCKGVCDGVETESLEKSSSIDLCASGECFDEILLAGLDGKLADPGKGRLLVLHQKGSHGPAYHRRYPAVFERFTPTCNSDDFDDCTQEEIRNAYDNSILYTDDFLGEVIERLDAASGRFDTAMLYVSDHGESLGENGLYLHGLPYAIAPETQTRVPMVLWMSPQFEERFSINTTGIERAAGSDRFSHDNLFHSVLGALDVETSVYDSRLDIFATGRLASTGRGPSGIGPGS
jgi:lipid A ethanolaminephosphotransferase